MLKFLRNSFIILSLFSLFVITPIYAVVRIVVPNALLSRVSDYLPAGISLSVGEVISKANLDIVYVDVELVFESGTVSIPSLKLSPVLHYKKPVRVILEELRVDSDALKIVGKGLESEVLLSGFDLSNLTIEGQFEKINSPKEAIISHGNFVIAGINSASKRLDITAQTVELISQMPKGILNIKLENANAILNFNRALVGEILSSGIELVFSSIDGNSFSPEIFGDDFTLDVALQDNGNGMNWMMPLDLNVNNIRSNNTHISQNLQVNASGKWTGNDLTSCSYYQVLRGGEGCGKMTDIHNVMLLLENGSERTVFSGNGYCVTPRSGCRQVIHSRVDSRGTQAMFSRLLQSNAVNPVFLSILMGMLLGSPSNDSEFEHTIELKVDGSEILVNDLSLF